MSGIMRASGELKYWFCNDCKKKQKHTPNQVFWRQVKCECGCNKFIWYTRELDRKLREERRKKE